GPSAGEPGHRRGPLPARLRLQARGRRLRARLRPVHGRVGDPRPGTWQLPNSSSVMNNHAGGGTEPCGPDDTSTLADALRQSCNTSFAMLGVDLGEEQLRETAEGFGFGQRMEIPLSVTPSTIGQDLDDAQLATTSIGQYETRVTPLQMAMVAGTFAND